MNATEILVNEHRLIKKVLDWGETEIARIESGGHPEMNKLAKAIDFIRNFADRCHHAKEEGLLFKRLIEKGMPGENGPIAVMLHEHDLGRAHVAALAASLDGAGRGEPAALAQLREHLAGYIGLLRAHIDKEDHILYPMADRLLDADDQEALLADFERLENEEIGAGVHEKYHRLAEELR
jgi:hemerythrin-like domain-containing protein